MIPQYRLLRRPLKQDVVWSAEEWARWLGYMKAQLETLESLVLVAYAEGTKEHVRVRWSIICLRMFLERLRLALSVVPLSPQEYH